MKIPAQHNGCPSVRSAPSADSVRQFPKLSPPPPYKIGVV